MKAREAATDKVRQELQAKLVAPDVDITKAEDESPAVAKAREAYEQAVRMRGKASEAAQKASGRGRNVDAKHRAADIATEKAERALSALNRLITADLQAKLREL